MATITEAAVEDVTLAWLSDLGWEVLYGPDISDGGERNDHSQVVLDRRLRDALTRLNPDLPAAALQDAQRRLTHPEGATLEARNRSFHQMLVDGVTVEYGTDEGAVRSVQATILGFDDPTANDWLAVNQFTVTEDRNNRRPDVILFVNGLPLGVIELKNPMDENATVWTAWQQLQTYQAELPTLFSMNEILMVSDGIDARVGALGAGQEWFKPWRAISGDSEASPHLSRLQVMLEGVCEHGQFLALVRDFIVFDDDGSGTLIKKMAGYHQFHAVRYALNETLRAAGLLPAERYSSDEDRSGGTKQRAGRRGRGPAHWGGLAHAGLRQEPDHGLLRRSRHAGIGHGQSHHRRHHRPQ